MAAQFTQPGQQSSSDKPITNSVTMSSFSSSNGVVGSAESKSQLLSAGPSRDVSTSSGIGSSLSSSDYLHQSGNGGVALDHSSSSTTRDHNISSSVLVRRQPDSLPRVGPGRVSADRNSLSNSQSTTHVVTTNALSHPKPLFGVGKSSSNRYVS